MSIFTDYLNNGFHCHPIATDGSKAPACKSWQELVERFPTPDELEEWDRAGYGVGVPCGVENNNLEVIDVDDPTISRRFVQAIFDGLPGIGERISIVATPREIEGRRGVHIYYRCDAVEGNQKLARSADGNARIETRGTGGYVVGVGSPPACHPTGNQWQHAKGVPPWSVQAITREERDFVFALAKGYDEKAKEAEPPQYTPNEHEARDDAPGTLFNQQMDWGALLIPRGWTKQQTDAKGITHWSRPGKAAGTSATTGLGEGKDLLYCFSTTEGETGLKADTTYSKFAFIAAHDFGGDFGACARELVNQGFSTPSEPKREKTEIRSFDQVMRKHLADVRDGKIRPVKTGITSLDSLTGGVEFGEFILVAALPTHGKTLVSMHLLDQLAQAGHASAFISLDMSERQISGRLIRRASKRRDWKHDYDKVKADIAEYNRNRAPIYLSTPGVELARVELAIEDYVEQGVKVFCVDYVQQISSNGSRYEQVTLASQRIRDLTTKHNLLFFACAQLTTEIGTPKNFLYAQNLRDSRQLAQDADVVIMVDWPYKRDDDYMPQDDINLVVRKSRNRGQTGMARMRVDGERMTLYERD